MLKLIKLEFKKNKFNGSLLGILIVNVAIIAMTLLMYFNFGSLEEEVSFSNYQEAFNIIDTFVRAAFIIYASTLIAKFVIEEYRNKTMSLMFTYPIDRKKLIAAKLVIVFIWTLFTIIFSNLVITTIFVLINNHYGYINEALTTDLIINNGLQILLNAVAAAGLGLIPLFFGMLKKSIVGTIVSSVLIVSFIGSNYGDFSLSSIIAIPLSLAVVGILIAYLSIRNIDKVDLF